ncbi:MAG: hypothetical protein R3E89_07840 [Thiolinea sp.]
MQAQHKIPIRLLRLGKMRTYGKWLRGERLPKGAGVAIEDVLLPVSHAPALTRTGFHESLYLY